MYVCESSYINHNVLQLLARIESAPHRHKLPKPPCIMHHIQSRSLIIHGKQTHDHARKRTPARAYLQGFTQMCDARVILSASYKVCGLLCVCVCANEFALMLAVSRIFFMRTIYKVTSYIHIVQNSRSPNEQCVKFQEQCFLMPTMCNKVTYNHIPYICATIIHHIYRFTIEC